ncbi:unnamed protein product [Amoebophrya sp. A25]|nr:unnamed protein product [Amoebophrya sp. A25]|eukprot:GSA25T00020910001.1
MISMRALIALLDIEELEATCCMLMLTALVLKDSCRSTVLRRCSTSEMIKLPDEGELQECASIFLKLRCMDQNWKGAGTRMGGNMRLSTKKVESSIKKVEVGEKQKVEAYKNKSQKGRRIARKGRT